MQNVHGSCGESGAPWGLHPTVVGMQRGVWASVVAVTMCAGLVGCAPGAGAEPREPSTARSQPSTASSEPPVDATAAAKAAVAEYVDASNQVDYSDPDTFDSVYALVTGEQLENERSSLQRFHDLKWTHSGESVLQLLEPAPGQDDSQTVEFNACLNLSSVKFLDDEGIQRVPPDAVDIAPVSFTTVLGEDSVWRISTLAGRSGEPTCG